jgi:hypothetical protein
MAVIDLNNIVRPKKKNNPTMQVTDVVTEQRPVYVDLHLDLETDKNVGLGLNAVNSGDILVDIDIEAIKNSLRNIFNTKKGQKILNPEFGSSLEQYLFTPITEPNAKAIGNQILKYVNAYEPRINISNVIVSPKIDQNLYYIAIYYNLLEINRNDIINIVAQLGGQVFI